MSSGCFDHSAIWSRTKICRRNRSSVVCASAISSGNSGMRGTKNSILVDVQVRERLLQFRRLRVGEPGLADGKHVDMRQPLQLLDHRGRDRDADERKLLDLFHLLELRQAFVGN